MAKEKEAKATEPKWKLGDVRCANGETAQLLEIGEFSPHASAFPLIGRVKRHNTMWDASGKNCNNPSHDLIA